MALGSNKIWDIYKTSLFEIGLQMPIESIERLRMDEFPSITRTLGVMGGKPCVRGMRVTVGMIAGQIGSGTTIDEMLDDYPYLQRDDILEAIRYAGALASNAANRIQPEDSDFDGFAINLGEEVS
jgi:uncharacterized protein (DUF433 family)